MEVLYLLENIRIPGLNEFMLLITKLGEETAFLAAALIVFWCVDKHKGYYLMAVGFLGTMVNQFLKLTFRVPRPWVLDSNFTILEAARGTANGYSFPSGHSQSAVGTFGAIAMVSKQKWIRGICIAIAVLVPFSRMYIGVHTPADVLAGASCALVLIFLLKPIAKPEGEGWMKWVIALMLALAVGQMLFVQFYPFPADVDAHNLQSGTKSAYTMLGCLLGVAVVYGLEKKYVQFATQAVWWSQILKVILGLGVVLLVKEGLRAPLEMVFSTYPARAVRYFLIVLTAGLLWPMTFRWFSKLGVKHELRND